MDFIKKHYEKILLGLVLVGLVVAAAFLSFMISGEQQSLTETRQKMLAHPVKPLPPLDLSRAEGLLNRLQAPVPLDFSTTNKLFNPRRWQKMADGRMIEEPTEGPAALCQITKISPLYTTITLDEVRPSDSGPRYVIGVERKAARTPALQRKVPRVAALHSTVKLDTFGFTVRELKGPAENPTELVLELSDTSELAPLAKDKPFQRVDGYAVDLKYEPEKSVWLNRRVGDRISFASEDYIIVAITPNEVVLLAKSNQKKTPIPYHPGP